MTAVTCKKHSHLTLMEADAFTALHLNSLREQNLREKMEKVHLSFCLFSETASIRRHLGLAVNLTPHVLRGDQRHDTRQHNPQSLRNHSFTLTRSVLWFPLVSCRLGRKIPGWSYAGLAIVNVGST